MGASCTPSSMFDAPGLSSHGGGWQWGPESAERYSCSRVKVLLFQKEIVTQHFLGISNYRFTLRLELFVR